ncbi:MAG TPA: CbtA family protein [Alphaproteobacteria bacterium]|jgi:cobalt transporter subunit CbtA|nr:CbtA family protein [Alphaproteobacteria bacterium]
MITRVLWAAVIAGLIAGAVATAVQLTRLVPLIAIAEEYETAAAAHEHAAHADHGDAATATADEADEWEPTGWTRPAFTALFNALAGVGYGLLLVAGMTLAGRPMTPTSGLLWGLAGFLAFAAAPAFGLPPELPGMPAADLVARQSWWIGTAVATAAGLAALAFGSRTVKAVGVALLVVPHLIGAPHLAEHVAGAGVPAEFAAQFVAASMLSALLFWLALGASAGHLLSRRQ